MQQVGTAVSTSVSASLSLAMMLTVLSTGSRQRFFWTARIGFAVCMHWVDSSRRPCLPLPSALLQEEGRKGTAWRARKDRGNRTNSPFSLLDGW